MYKVKVLNQNGIQQELVCKDNQTLLDAANIQGVTINYACKGGGCGLCKIKVNEGSYERGKSSKAVLPDSEREQDYTLACKTFPKSDMQVLV
ncbi:2Fe-2S iron-sulfur cluster binding domain-containing protein [Bacillus benzoevorans]|uniref:CDP-4-dehydro-6-deoxyglucose reductase n=1 Tax=Bacillus benzoevorans TaxID=1456 RepID=A0A7X0HQ79_9BACI|nr:2Fe-2S iron-sulfur cluster binding domain-containing protein [Bacillus benzoevorans]MBB6444937.1 CDP-4-dehydro-6-deoxyglucose reductase [Bacillus benzoevorans]